MSIQRIIAIIIAVLFPSLGFAEACIDHLDQHVENTTLNLGSCQLTESDIPLVVIPYLNAHPNITGVSLSGQQWRVSSESIYMIIQNTALTSLDVSWTFADDRIIPALASNTHLEKLDLSNTGIDAQGLVALAANKHLKSLAILEVEISNEAISALADNPSLTALYFGRRYRIKEQMNENTLLHVAQNYHLSRLGMVGQVLTPKVLEALAQNQHLSFLLLPYDNIDDRGARNIAMMGGLRELYLDGNPITDDGVIAISSNSSIQKLSLKGTSLSETSIYVLAANTHLKQLDLSDTGGLSVDSLRALAGNTTLTTLDLEKTGLYDDMAEIISHIKTLQCLNISFNHIGDNGAMAIANNMVIDTLAMTKDEMSLSSQAAIKANTHIKHLDFSNLFVTPCLYRFEPNGIHHA